MKQIKFMIFALLFLTACAGETIMTGISETGINLQRADDGNRHTQLEWIQIYNDNNEVMTSTADVYRAAKANDQEAIKAFRKDFKDSWFTTSTRILYHKNDLGGTIVHYYGSTQTAEKRINVSVIGELDGKNFNEEDLPFLQALFDTDDNLQEIMRVLETLTGKTQDQFYFWTPSQDSRKSNPSRAVRLYCNDFDGRFYVVGDDWGGNYGLSHGVLLDSAKRTNSKVSP